VTVADDPKPPPARAKTSPPAAGGKGYKRSWKNLLINKRYQLQFTLFMVGLATLLMTGLGIRVMMKANDATTVSKIHVISMGMECPAITDAPGFVPKSTEVAPPPKPDEPPPPPPETVLGDVQSQWCNGDEFTCDAPPAIGAPLVVKLAPVGSAAPDAGECDDTIAHKLGEAEAIDPLHKANIKTVACTGGGKPHEVPAKARRQKPVVDESSLRMDPGAGSAAPAPTPAPEVPVDTTPKMSFAESVAAHYACEIKHANQLDRLDDQRLLILLVLIGSGLVLIALLAVYGIRTTHKVAGPLFKISLYLAKMRDGRYDKVWNLRKGDQLVEFYDHFKAAHAGVVAMEKDDIARLRAVIAAAEKAGQGEHATIVELRAMLARKEKSVE
jgi:hypothetical protein